MAADRVPHRGLSLLQPRAPFAGAHALAHVPPAGGQAHFHALRLALAARAALCWPRSARRRPSRRRHPQVGHLRPHAAREVAGRPPAPPPNCSSRGPERGHVARPARSRRLVRPPSSAGRAPERPGMAGGWWVARARPEGARRGAQRRRRARWPRGLWRACALAQRLGAMERGVVPRSTMTMRCSEAPGLV